MKKLILLMLSLSFNVHATTKVAITIDDLPIHSDIPKTMSRVDVAKEMLATLKEEKIPEVYGFINASKAEFQPETKEVLKLWIDAGYPLGNHTYTHMDLHQHSAIEFEKDIAINEKMLKELGDKYNWKVFRYPYLREGETMDKRNAIRKYLADNHYQTAQVSIDFEDWSWNDPYVRCLTKNDKKSLEWLEKTYQQDAIVKLEEAKKMSTALLKRDITHILLLHIGVFDAKMLKSLIRNYREHDVEFVSLSEAMKDDVYKNDPAIAQKWGSEILQQIRKARNLTMKDLGMEVYRGYSLEELEKRCL
jgi:peptidoglycan/xylan/chitin deacetylase (PgdA/CDA1 family)